MKKAFLVFISFLGYINVCFGETDDFTNLGMYSECFQTILDSLLIYPETAEKDSIEGRVMIQFTISEDGSIEDVKIVESLRADADSVVITAIRRIKFDDAPAYSYYTRKPLKIFCRLPIIFTLQNEKKQRKYKPECFKYIISESPKATDSSTRPPAIK